MPDSTATNAANYTTTWDTINTIIYQPAEAIPHRSATRPSDQETRSPIRQPSLRSPSLSGGGTNPSRFIRLRCDTEIPRKAAASFVRSTRFAAISGGSVFRNGCKMRARGLLTPICSDFARLSRG